MSSTVEAAGILHQLEARIEKLARGRVESTMRQCQREIGEVLMHHLPYLASEDLNFEEVSRHIRGVWGEDGDLWSQLCDEVKAKIMDNLLKGALAKDTPLDAPSRP